LVVVLAAGTDLLARRVVLAVALGLITPAQTLQVALAHQGKVMLAVLTMMALTISNQAAAGVPEPLGVMVPLL
jgi:hypothetical protein